MAAHTLYSLIQSPSAPTTTTASRGLFSFFSFFFLRGTELRSEPLFVGLQCSTVAQSITVEEAAKDWQLGQHIHTQMNTQENKGVYKPASGDDCPTVPETTEAYCSGSQWRLSLRNVKNPTGRSAQQSGGRS